MTLDLTPLQGIPKHLLPKNITSIQIIKGGLNNRNLLINESYLLKEYLQRDEKNDPVRLRYLREKTAFIQLANINFLPILHHSYEKENKFYLARSWVEGEIANLGNIDRIFNNLILVISSLHNQQYTCNADYNYFDVIHRYMQEYKHLSNHEKWDLPDKTSILYFYGQKREELAEFASSELLTRIHGDLVFSNIINSHQRCILIDWEYSTIGNPLIDLAYFITQNSITLKIENALIRRYEQINSLEIDPRHLSIYKSLMYFMSALWYALQILRFSNNVHINTEQDFSRSQFEERAKQGFSQLRID